MKSKFLWKRETYSSLIETPEIVMAQIPDGRYKNPYVLSANAG